MRVLVTGSAGYIGRHLVPALKTAGHEVLEFDIASRLDDGPHDAVIHLAGVSSVAHSMRVATDCWRTNVARTIDMLHEYIMRRETTWIVNASSCAVYGERGLMPVNETAQPAPLSPYGRSKLAAEWATSDACRSHGLSAISLRLFNVAGSADPNGHRLLPALCRCAREGVPLIAHGNATRDYVHVEDVCRAFVLALAALSTGKVDRGEHLSVNIGRGAGVSLQLLARTVATISGRRVDIDERMPRPGDPSGCIATNYRARALLDWEAVHGLDDIVRSAWEAASNE